MGMRLHCKIFIFRIACIAPWLSNIGQLWREIKELKPISTKKFVPKIKCDIHISHSKYREHQFKRESTQDEVHSL
jgi:hypothetical protein